MESRLRYVLTALVLAILLGSSAGLAKAGGSPFHGKWLYYKLIYKGQPMDPISPDLVMTLDFNETNINLLHYERKGQTGFCERQALWLYNVRSKTLYQRITWVNPNNRSDCSQDPDMHMNGESWSIMEVINHDLHLQVPFSDEELTVVWRRI